MIDGKKGKRGLDLIKPDDITITLNIDGTARTMLELQRLYGTSRSLIYTRWKKGWSDYECVYGKPLTKPIK